MASVSADKIEKSCVEVSQILKALAHPQRLILLGNLLEGPKTVGELVTLCGASQSQISHFLMRMKLEGLVKAEREGRFVLYSVADKRLIRLMRVIQSEYCEHEQRRS
ncbi:MAG TPA: metalloregulator ArsR/SmtB family transcription factor [Pseudobdellovibrionaceae bacterium]|mgnify:CR=1 FL=1|nr:metalloregulator ArsR/SmtB family transcription factor [Pseudobdellovibrionaceae bacterium]